MINSHNESVLRDGEDAELGPGQCACGQFPAVCADCGRALECTGCWAPGQCGCAVPAAVVDAPTVNLGELATQTMRAIVWGTP